LNPNLHWIKMKKKREQKVSKKSKEIIKKISEEYKESLTRLAKK
jgi:hypothetical protein